MCGIAGLLRPAPSEDLRTAVRIMRDTLTHRGPDAAGEWSQDGVALGHRRLSIVDLSEAGAQPMTSASGRYVIAYNGEAYGFRELRDELAGLGHAFRGGSDTEVVLAAIEEWGVRRAVPRLVGMFAFALWDHEERTLTLGRDRLGIKPLYVARLPDGHAFASELRAIEAVEGFERRLDRDSLALYFRYVCVPGGRSIYEGVEQVCPGELWTFREGQPDPVRDAFWRATDIAARGLADPLTGTYEQSVERVEAALLEAVRERMVADVPLGVFLSGGIDSSVVTALMQASSSQPVRSFSIGFESAAYDEGEDAARVAAHLGTDHTALTLTPDDALNVIPELGHLYDEPFADSSQLPTTLVCRLARREVTVALSGDGGDEVFGGYNRHIWAPRVSKALRAAPPPLRRAVAHLLSSRTPAQWDAFASRHRATMPLLNVRQPGDKAHKLAGLLAAQDLRELYLRLTSIWPNPEALVRGAHPPTRPLPALLGAHVSEQVMLADLLGYLPDDILTKVDRASMSTSLEVRVPLLDHRVVELGWRLPLRHKVRGGVGKRVLRDVLARHVPRALFERPKMGFGVPIDAWLRGPLRGWAEDLLSTDRIRAQGLLEPEVVSNCWQEHLAGTATRQHQLWAILMFQSWMDAR